ncbi:Chitinase 2 [Linderina pennispora]|nr:Chitinase 2 [Linderina pennispora]
MAADIKSCQSEGKVVLLSLGGASGAYSFSSDDDGRNFAETVWNKFFRGSDPQRPFDDAVLDGIDLDIEGGSTTGYAAFIEQLRLHYKSDPSKRYYIASAPQCPFPDTYLGPVLNSAWFDMVFVQFYNNYCSLNAFPSWFNFNDWDNWAKTQSVNKGVKVFIGAPGASSAASYGYVDGATLQRIYESVRATYSSLGGIMTWDVSQARTSGLAGSIRAFLDSSGHCNTNLTTSEGSLADTSSVYTASSETPAALHSLQTSPETEVATTTTVSKTAPEVPSTSKTRTITFKMPKTSGSSTSSSTASTENQLRTTSSSTKNHLWGWSKATSHSKTSAQSSTPLTSKQSTRDLPTDSVSSSALPISTSDAPASPADSICPVEGTHCDAFSQACTLTGYALCVRGKWALYPCVSGTACYLFGASAACDWHNSNEKPVCTVSSAEQFAHITRPKAPPARSKVWTLWHFPVVDKQGVKARVEFLANHIRDGHYRALIKLTSLEDPIPDNWMLQFELPSGQTLESANGGAVSIANSTVTIHADDKFKFNRQSRMSVAIGVSGQYSSGYVVPDLSTALIAQHQRTF